ncbi:MAG TPA: YceI family protein [Bacteroidales bacterium]|nr:YceI family protein [Bacteroidales bacterium]
MTKCIKFGGLLSIILILVSCGPAGEKANSSNPESVLNAAGIVYNADISKSVINWEGTKPGGSHVGTISVQTGTVNIDKGQVVGGSFLIDMKSIKNTDLTDAEYNKKLVGHLMSPDFFAVDSFPTAKFEITKVEALAQAESIEGVNVNSLVSGNLTIKNISRAIQFKANISVNEDAGTVTATSVKFVIDRSEWKIKYGSRKFFDNLKDKFINDEIGLKVMIMATKASVSANYTIPTRMNNPEC